MGQRQFSQAKPTSAKHQPAAKNEARTPLHPLLQLQAAIGNQAVGRAIAAQWQDSQSESGWNQPKPTFRGLSHELTGSLQQSSPIQAKLPVGEPKQEYEEEDDRSGTQVVKQMQASQSQIVQREEMPSKEQWINKTGLPDNLNAHLG